MPTKKNIAYRLKITRHALGFGDRRAEFARLLDMSPNTYRNAERGRNRLQPEVAAKMCRSCKLTMDWFYLGVIDGLPHDLAVAIQKLLNTGLG